MTTWRVYTLHSFVLSLLYFFVFAFVATTILKTWLDSLQHFNWQVSDWSSLIMHKRSREGGGRPSDPSEPIQGCIPLHPFPLPSPPECLCNWRLWRVNSIMSCLLVSWYCGTLYYKQMCKCLNKKTNKKNPTFGAKYFCNLPSLSSALL